MSNPTESSPDPLSHRSECTDRDPSMTRVMFVDDEPQILRGLERMLRPFRRRWHMSFADSGPDALARFEAEPFDVVVADMRMPGMNGAELLAEVKRISPRTIRIVLSGHADAESAMRSVLVSHQFLAKPCDPDALCEAVQRASNLQVLLSSPRLQRAIGDLAELPVLPQVYDELRRVLASAEPDIDRIGELVSRDQGIASKVLQIVNSSYFGIRQDIASLQQATMFLGTNTIRDLVLTFGTFGQFEGAKLPQGFSITAQQDHAMQVATIASALLETKREKDQAFIAGLLHDVGKLVLATQMPQSFAAVAGRCAGSERHCSSEMVELGVTHAEVGAYLLGIWGLSYPIVEAIAYHHAPYAVERQTSLGVLGAVHVADALAHEFTNNDASKSRIDEAYLDSIGVLGDLPKWRATGELLMTNR